MPDEPLSLSGLLKAQEERDELRAENERLKAEKRGLSETIAEWQAIHGTFTGDVHVACQAEIERLRAVATAVQNYRQAAADAGHPMLPWPALDIALDALGDAKDG